MKYLRTIALPLYLAVLAAAAGAPRAVAAIIECGNENIEEGQPFNVCGYSDFMETVGRMVDFVLYGVAALATIMIIIGGLKMLTSNGKQGQMMAGRKMIEGVSLGLLLVFGAWAIVHAILGIFFPQGS